MGNLKIGGAERAAVNIVNILPRDRYRPFLCTTRGGGPLEDLVAKDVTYLRLSRAGRFDIIAIVKLSSFIRRHKIQILHSHGPALFIAVAASLLPPYPAVIWHDRNGKVINRPVLPYWVAARRLSSIIAVNEQLVEWARNRLKVPSHRVSYIRNFVVAKDANLSIPDLPGCDSYRVVCVANLRPIKDHPTLVNAWKMVVEQVPQAHLLLVGSVTDSAHMQALKSEIERLDLQEKVSVLGARNDVMEILRGCDIGVLSSVSEGLPHTLIEYGIAGLAAISTRVGGCGEVLNEGEAGILVPPSSPEMLAKGIIKLLRSPELRKKLGGELNRWVNQNFSHHIAMEKIENIYETVLGFDSKDANSADRSN